MENTQNEQNTSHNADYTGLYELSLNLLITHKKPSWEVIKILTDQGITSDKAVQVVGSAVDTVNGEIR